MSWLAAALVVCSRGDPVVVQQIVQTAEQQSVPVEMALAVACVESGIRGPNPMGVQACYGSVRNPPGPAVCIQIGVRSLKSKLPNVLTKSATKRVFRRYNNSSHRDQYACKTYHILEVMRRNR